MHLTEHMWFKASLLAAALTFATISVMVARAALWPVCFTAWLRFCTYN